MIDRNLESSHTSILADLMHIYLDTSDTARSGARTGIQTVVRGLIDGLSANCAVHPVRWSFRSGALTPLKPKWENNLGRPSGKNVLLPLQSLLAPRHWPLWVRTMGMDYKAPLHLHPRHEPLLKGTWLLLPELIEGRHVRLSAAYARRRGMRVAGIFHDAIPWLHPEMVLHWTRDQHADYMRAFAELDAVIPVSNKSAQDFIRFVQSQGLPLPPVRACGLAAQIFGFERETQLKAAAGTVKILCVSTLEPRKNHALLLKAFEEACSLLGDLKVELHLVGGVYASAPEIAEAVRAATMRNPSIFWHNSAGPEQLRNFYRDCDFTVFSSWIEGFGLPVMESLWFGRPCLCSDQGVMAENAKGGGCLTVDMQDTHAMAEAIIKLASQPDFRRTLGEQVLQRKLKTWTDYAAGILEILKPPASAIG
jgi:glycosyltransferase involved in cell wall biosynthesis